MSSRKRQKTCRTSKKFSTLSSNEILIPKHTIDTLPQEVLEMILRFLPLHVVATTVRLVSSRWLMVATAILNGGFLLMGVRLEKTMSWIESKMNTAKKDAELLAYSRTFNSLELIRAQYKMLKAVTWRYTHPMRQNKCTRLCFYAGGLLDELHELLHRAENCTKIPCTNSYGPDTNVVYFMSLCTRFMNYFEKMSERRINKNPLISGCKIVDLLDCLIEGREVQSFHVSSGRGGRGEMVTMRLRYLIKRAWFTCLRIPKPHDENSWKDEQCFMYLRLRRLVCNVNQHLFEKIHFERERMIQPPRVRISRPPASTYSGYGEYGGKFFYYGNMNNYAYESKFKLSETPQDQDNETENELLSGPCFDLIMNVELRCSPDLIPYAIKTALQADDLEFDNDGIHCNRELYFKLNVKCPASVTNRLPGNFVWELHGPRSVCSNKNRFS